MKTSCAFPDGTGYHCDANGEWCKPYHAGSPNPTKDIPVAGGQVGDDLALSPSSPKVGRVAPSGAGQSAAASDDDQDQDSNKSNDSKSKKGKGRKK